MAYALRAEPSRAGSSNHRPGCSAGQRDGSTVCRNECGVASGGPRNQQEGETFPAIMGGRWGLRVSLSLVWSGAQCRMKTWGPRLESRPGRPVNDRCSDTQRPPFFCMSLPPARGPRCRYTSRTGHPFKGGLSSGLRVTPRGSGPLPALVPAGVTEKHVQSWSGRMSLPGRGQPCSGHSTGCWGGEGAHVRGTLTPGSGGSRFQHRASRVTGAREENGASSSGKEKCVTTSPYALRGRRTGV